MSQAGSHVPPSAKIAPSHSISLKGRRKVPKKTRKANVWSVSICHIVPCRAEGTQRGMWPPSSSMKIVHT